MGGRRWLRPALLAALVAAAVALAVAGALPSAGSVRSWADGAGRAGPPLVALLYAGLTLAPVPKAPLSTAAGALFGLPVGLAAVLAGAVAGAGVAFGLARWLGRSAVARLDRERLVRLDALLRRRGLLAVVAVRLVPLAPFTALNYACGLTAVRTRDYLLGTAVGILPGAAAYVALGAYGTDPGSVPFLVAVGGLAALAVGGLVVARRRPAGA